MRLVACPPEAARAAAEEIAAGRRDQQWRIGGRLLLPLGDRRRAAEFVRSPRVHPSVRATPPDGEAGAGRASSDGRQVREIADLMARDRGIRLAAVLGAAWLATALNLTLALRHSDLSFALYWAEVALFSRVAGAATGAFALTVTSLCVLFFFVPPAFSLRIETLPDAVRLASYLGGGALVWAASSWWRRRA